MPALVRRRKERDKDSEIEMGRMREVWIQLAHQGRDKTRSVHLAQMIKQASTQTKAAPRTQNQRIVGEAKRKGKRGIGADHEQTRQGG